MDIRKEISLSAIAKTEDNTPIMTFQGSINSNEPNDINYSFGIMNQGLYRENRDRMETERRAFEDALYAEQDKMIAARYADKEEK